MDTIANRTGIARKPISNLRWWIGGLLFASTVINYIDRQTLSVLGPYLKLQYQWNNQQFATIVIAFRAAYSIGQTVSGRLIDRIGTRKGLTITVIWYSIAAMLTSLAGGLRSFAFFRFLLGAGESANWPAATKAVAEWFPKKERALATGIFNSGTNIGALVTRILIAVFFTILLLTGNTMAQSIRELWGNGPTAASDAAFPLQQASQAYAHKPVRGKNVLVVDR